MFRVTPLGTLMRERRQKLGMSAREVAEAAEISHTYVNNLENGKNDLPSREVVAGLARVLEVSEEELARAAYWIDAPKESPSDVEAGVSLREVVDALDQIDRLPTLAAQEEALSALPSRLQDRIRSLARQLRASANGEGPGSDG